MNDETFTFVPAIRTNTPLIIGICGASGSGKTFTSLELAAGLAGADGRIALIDTEGRRALIYADLPGRDGGLRFRFNHLDLHSPYSPQRFLRALQAAEQAGYEVVVIDSASDEYIGSGGLVDMAAEEEKRVHNTAAAWAKPKSQHKLLIRWLRQSRCHILWLMRAEEKVRLEKVERQGKEQTVVVPIGFQPIAEKNTAYEMTVSFMLTPDAPGVPQPIKLPEQFKPFFPLGKSITREAGRLLAEWCAGGVPASAVEESVLDRARRAAELGSAELEKFWRGLVARDDRLLVRPLLGTRERPGDLLALAIEADADLIREQEDPFWVSSAAALAEELSGSDGREKSDIESAVEQAESQL